MWIVCSSTVTYSEKITKLLGWKKTNQILCKSTKLQKKTANLLCITILLHKLSIFPARAWYLLVCFRIFDDTLDRSLFPILSKFSSSCSSNFSLEDTPEASPSNFQGDSLLRINIWCTSISCIMLQLTLWHNILMQTVQIYLEAKCFRWHNDSRDSYCTSCNKEHVKSTYCGNSIIPSLKFSLAIW